MARNGGESLCSENNIGDMPKRSDRGLYEGYFMSPTKMEMDTFNGIRTLIEAGRMPQSGFVKTLSIENAQKVISMTDSEMRSTLHSDATLATFVEQIIQGGDIDWLGFLSLENPLSHFVLMRLTMEHKAGILPILAKFFDKDPALFEANRLLEIKGEKITLGDSVRSSVDPTRFAIEGVRRLKNQCGR